MAMTPIRRILAIAATIAVVVSGAALVVGIQHNAQAEFYDPETGVTHVGYMMLVFTTWFVPVFSLMSLVGFGVLALVRVGRRRHSP